MTAKLANRPGQRVGLTRRGILEAALRYIDEHGADSLSMHKLGATLGVKAMSLYNHVSNKDDVLDGVVVTMWEEIEDSLGAVDLDDDWCAALRSFAYAVRDVIRRHPNAAPLMSSQQIMPRPALRIVGAYTQAALRSGINEPRAHDILRTINSYALGSAFVEIRWGIGSVGCAPSVDDLLRPDVPDDLASIAHAFCGNSNADKQFELGLDLMLRGLASSS